MEPRGRGLAGPPGSARWGRGRGGVRWRRGCSGSRGRWWQQRPPALGQAVPRAGGAPAAAWRSDGRLDARGGGRALRAGEGRGEKGVFHWPLLPATSPAPPCPPTRRSERRCGSTGRSGRSSRGPCLTAATTASRTGGRGEQHPLYYTRYCAGRGRQRVGQPHAPLPAGTTQSCAAQNGIAASSAVRRSPPTLELAQWVCD